MEKNGGEDTEVYSILDNGILFGLVRSVLSNYRTTLDNGDME